ncbi:hypothetical protein HG530_015225 [Fusarium avenaceum]|nr:hypothetical protein HG530_015225 [Fusarium avenaceum]
MNRVDNSRYGQWWKDKVFAELLSGKGIHDANYVDTICRDVRPECPCQFSSPPTWNAPVLCCDKKCAEEEVANAKQARQDREGRRERIEEDLAGHMGRDDAGSTQDHAQEGDSLDGYRGD